MTRSFQGYTMQRADSIVGLGVSAISSTPRMHWQSYSQLPRWTQAVTAGELPVARGIELDSDDQLRRTVINRLMCEGELDLRRFGAEHGLDSPSFFAAEVAALGALGELVHYDPDAQVLRVTELVRLLIRNVCMVFDHYTSGTVAGSAPVRFSPAI